MLDQSVHPSENVSRFLKKDQIRSSDNAVRYGAFLPSPSKLKISVFRVDDLSEKEIWALAVEKVEPLRGPILGRGDLSVDKITENNLQVAPDEDFTSRHADIVGWPDDRDLRATIAKVLAGHASPAKKR